MKNDVWIDWDEGAIQEIAKFDVFDMMDDYGQKVYSAMQNKGEYKVYKGVRRFAVDIQGADLAVESRTGETARLFARIEAV